MICIFAVTEGARGRSPRRGRAYASGRQLAGDCARTGHVRLVRRHEAGRRLAAVPEAAAQVCELDAAGKTPQQNVGATGDRRSPPRVDGRDRRRAYVLPGRVTDVIEEWPRGYPGVQVVCRDGSGADGEAVRPGCSAAVQTATAGTCGTA